MKKIELDVKGMHCKSCVIILTDALTEHKGVKDAKVDLKKSNATVSYDDRMIDKSKLIQIISKEGYEAKMSRTAKYVLDHDQKSVISGTSR